MATADGDSVPVVGDTNVGANFNTIVLVHINLAVGVIII